MDDKISRRFRIEQLLKNVKRGGSFGLLFNECLEVLDSGTRIFSQEKSQEIVTRMVNFFPLPLGAGWIGVHILTELLEVSYFETDNFVWDRRYTAKRNPAELRDVMLLEVVSTDTWIIEGVHHKWGIESFEHADIIFIITPNKIIRDIRIILRFLRTRLGLEKSNYKQTIKNLFEMIFVWNKGFDKESMKEIMELTNIYHEKG